jgi:hypothetical protein
LRAIAYRLPWSSNATQAPTNRNGSRKSQNLKKLQRENTTMNESTQMANNLQILAGDILATRARELLEIIGPSRSDAYVALRDAVSTYTEVRIHSTMADGAAQLLQHIESKLETETKAPDTIRCPGAVDEEHAT